MIYADLECLLGKIDTRQNDPKKSSTEKKAEHTPSGYSWVTCCSFDKSKNEWNYYRGKNCMEMINYEKKEMILLTNEKKGLMKSKKFAIYVKKNLILIKNTVKSEKNKIPKEIPIVFHNGSR